MQNAITPSILAAERTNEGLVIKFSNGKCALFPTEFLWAKLPEVKELDENDSVW